MECPYCGGKDIVKAGKRYNKYVEKLRRYDVSKIRDFIWQ